MFIPEEKTVEIGGNNYLIKALPALYGLNMLNKFKFMEGNPSSEFIKELVFKSVTCNNLQPTEEWFNATFSRNYDNLFKLFEEIITFNFGGRDDEDGEDAGGKKIKKGKGASTNG